MQFLKNETEKDKSARLHFEWGILSNNLIPPNVFKEWFFFQITLNDIEFHFPRKKTHFV